jgi:hypothetical protein
MDVEDFENLGKKNVFFGFEAEEATFDRDRGRNGHRKISGTRLYYHGFLANYINSLLSKSRLDSMVKSSTATRCSCTKDFLSSPTKCPKTKEMEYPIIFLDALGWKNLLGQSANS